MIVKYSTARAMANYRPRLCCLAAAARSWRAISSQSSVASSSMSAHTILHPTPSALTKYLESRSPGPESTYLYLLSTSTSPAQISPLVTTLQSLPSSLGSFSISPPGTPPSLSLLRVEGGDVRSFRSEIEGRPGAEVGKYQRPGSSGRVWAEDQKGLSEGEVERRLAGGGGGWEEIWRPEGENQGDAQRISQLEGFDADSFLVLTAGKPNSFLRTLSSMYPDSASSTLGMVTAPTPFITSRPHTLFLNGDTYSTGAVGLAFKGKQEVDVGYPLEGLTGKFTVRGAQGNMLLKIDATNPNPTQTLIAALQARGSTMTKEEEFYLAISDLGVVQRVVKILSGDPSRGALALETEEPIVVGQTVQFMHRLPATTLPSAAADTLVFSALARHDSMEDTLEGESRIVDGFVGFSEDGFIAGSGVCNVPHATARWRL